MSYLAINGLSRKFPGEKPFAVNDVSFTLEKGEILALVGESGSGKTTILRLLGGLEIPDRGTIELDGRVLTNNNKSLPPEERRLGYVFQDYALFPHMNVLKNIAFGLDKLNSTDKAKAIDDILHLVNLKGFEHRFPHELSGGEQQRVALARALVTRPGLLLLDEPFSNLDFIKKDQVRRRVKRIIRQTQTTAIFVTHDTQEALSMADKIIVLKDGKVLQQGTPREIYDHPVNDYVAYFFGKVNLMALAVEDGITDIPFIDSFIKAEYLEKSDLRVFIRPENFKIQSTGKNEGIVKHVSFMGNRLELIVGMEWNGRELELVINAGTEHHFAEGDPISFDLKSNAIQVLD